MPFRLLTKLDKRDLGNAAEVYVLRLLGKEKYKILARNFSCRFGEIDIICQDRSGCVIFIEVRFRKTSPFASAAESVTPTKQGKIRKTAHYFLRSNPHLLRQVCRFDVFALQQSPETGELTTDWIKNAFC